MKKFVPLLFLAGLRILAQPHGDPLLEKGWQLLVKDDDAGAFRYFSEAYENAGLHNLPGAKADALLYMGICSFGASLENGLRYATMALDQYKMLAAARPELARAGRGKCLQLFSTIYQRQGKFAAARQMSEEVVETLSGSHDNTGTLGLAYISLGALDDRDGKKASAIAYFQKALADFRAHDNTAYLPGAYLKLGQSLGNHDYFKQALNIADKTQNKQAQVSALVALGKWNLAHQDPAAAEPLLRRALSLSEGLSDLSYQVQTLSALIGFKIDEKDYETASRLQKSLIDIKDRNYSVEREQIAKNLEVQFDVSEKNRKLALLARESEVSKLTNVILAISIVVLVLLFSLGFYFMRKINARSRELLTAKGALVEAMEKQETLKEAQFRADLEHKESQLSAITLQMLQKNELIDEVKAAIEKDHPLSGRDVLKMVNKHLSQARGWNDFDVYFEGINTNFYARLRQRYPDISANDLKICALIKLNLSIKEMASIMNISPDSVKTARYRLRKKLGLATEENLAGFIVSI